MIPTNPLALPAQEWVVGTATPMGPDDNGMYLGAMWYNGTNTPQDCALSYFNTNTTMLFVISTDAQNDLRGGRGQCRLGGGAQPVFRVDRDAEATGAGDCRASGQSCRR